MDLSWEQFLNFPLTPGLIGGFAGAFLVLAAGHFVATDFPERPSKWSWRKKALFLVTGTLTGMFLSLLVAIGDTGAVDWGNLRADWSKLLHYTVVGTGWFHIALGFTSAAKALAKAMTTSKQVVKATAQALLEADERTKVGRLGNA